MTCGIYLLKFKGTDNVYIGQSLNIQYRYKKHLQKMRNGTNSYKLQQAYYIYGEPDLDILVECSSADLDLYEREAIAVYDAVNRGFNTATEPDIHLKGDKNGAARYSNEQVAKVLDHLLDINLQYSSIAELTGVKENSVRHIANGESHMWLKEAFPEKYAKMLEVKGLRTRARASAFYKNKAYPALVSPDGVVYENISNVTAFAKEHGLDPSSLTKILNQRPKYKSHKGWKLKND